MWGDPTAGTTADRTSGAVGGCGWPPRCAPVSLICRRPGGAPLTLRDGGSSSVITAPRRGGPAPAPAGAHARAPLPLCSAGRCQRRRHSVHRSRRNVAKAARRRGRATVRLDRPFETRHSLPRSILLREAMRWRGASSDSRRGAVRTPQRAPRTAAPAWRPLPTGREGPTHRYAYQDGWLSPPAGVAAGFWVRVAQRPPPPLVTAHRPVEGASPGWRWRVALCGSVPAEKGAGLQEDSCALRGQLSRGTQGHNPRAVRGGDRTGWQDASPPGFSPLALDAVCETPSRCSVQTLCWGGAQPRGVACCTPVAEVARAVGWVSGVPANRAARSMASRPRGARPFTERGHHRRAGGPPFKTRGPCGIFGDTRRDSAGGKKKKGGAVLPASGQEGAPKAIAVTSGVHPLEHRLRNAPGNGGPTRSMEIGVCLLSTPTRLPPRQPAGG